MNKTSSDINTLSQERKCIKELYAHFYILIMSHPVSISLTHARSLSYDIKFCMNGDQKKDKEQC